MKSPDFTYEKSLLPPGCRFVLGLDEVGRGPWAGPVVIGAFLLDLNRLDHDLFPHNLIRDSKLLSAKQRQKTFQSICLSGFQYETVFASSEEIDKQGIQTAIVGSIYKILDKLTGQFDFALIDGNLKINHPLSRSVVKADRDCFSVAAASICAKITRDNFMFSMARVYPGYDFENNVGYGTPKHIIGLQKQGICPIHRRSFKPVRQFL